MSSITLPDPIAIAVPKDLLSATELDAWLQKKKLSIGSIEQVPEHWKDPLRARGLITKARGDQQLLLHTPGKVEALELPVLKDRVVFFVPSQN